MGDSAAPQTPNQAEADLETKAGQPVSATQMFLTEEVLWYKIGIWGDLGFGVPNFGTQTNSINSTIWQLVNLVGRNLFAIMMSTDSQLRIPPSINTLTKIHQLIVRARTILSSRALSPSQPRMESVHAAPAPRDFLIYPVPYFKVPNSYMAEYSGLILSALGEAMQHTENRIPYEISQIFAGQFGQYFSRIYQRMAVELFGIDPATASAPGFTLSSAQLASYNPNAWFTQTELVDIVPALNQIPPGNDPRVQVLAQGIPASQLIGLSSYPGGVSNPQAGGSTQSPVPVPVPPQQAVMFTGTFVAPPGQNPPSQ